MFGRTTPRAGVATPRSLDAIDAPGARARTTIVRAVAMVAIAGGE
jgi:hypothetical protein